MGKSFNFLHKINYIPNIIWKCLFLLLFKWEMTIAGSSLHHEAYGGNVTYINKKDVGQ